MTSPLVLYDRSRVCADWKCARARYWGYEYGGKGIASESMARELFTGTLVHDALAHIARRTLASEPVDIAELASTSGAALRDAIIGAAAPGVVEGDTLSFAREQAALVEGMILGFYQHQWPLLVDGKRIVLVEEEMQYRVSEGADTHQSLVFMSRPDLVLADADDNWSYVEYKTTSTKQTQWMNSWSTAVQVHSGIRAIEQTMGHSVQQVVIQGLFKGYSSYGRQNSPFTYAFVRSGQAPFTQDQVRYEYAAGYRRQPTWERPGGVAGWISGMPTDMLADQFPQAPPIMVNHSLVEAFFRQTMYREWLIRASRDRIHDTAYHLEHQDLLDRHFPQRFDQCRPAWGSGCQFTRLCHGRVDDPLRDGFTWRTPHHQPEIDAAAEA